jgi:hypothetical protein
MNSVRLSVLLAAGVLGAAAFTGSSRAAPSQHVVQYQGRLADGNGVPLEGTIGRLTFRLYSTATPTSASFLWGEAHVSTPVRRGVFSVNLGAGALTVAVDGSETAVPNPFAGEFDGGPRFLQVQVDGQAPLAPLQQLGSVPFAVAAGGSVPVGGVIDWYRPRASDPVPDGWVICDGQPITDADSPFNGTNAPNLVGRFTRGIANTPTFGADQGAPPSAGADSFAFTLPHGHGLTSHTHTIPDHSHSFSGTTDGPTYFPVPPNTNVLIGTFGSPNHSHTFSGTTNSVALTTGGGVGSTDNATPGTTVPTVPAHVGLLKIMRTR